MAIGWTTMVQPMVHMWAWPIADGKLCKNKDDFFVGKTQKQVST